MTKEMRLAVVIPCYKVTKQIRDVIAKIGANIHLIYVVDDYCPDNSGDYVKQHSQDNRIKILHNPVNLGVGGAVINGYHAAIADGADIVIKLDGDGQMDPDLINRLIKPITAGDADYVKGNRFYSLNDFENMPRVRLFGNAILGLVTKVSSGYWSIYDPTNGFTAIHRIALSRLNLDKISNGYFFETDMLINLGGIGARVMDMPMKSVYANEKSNLSIKSIIKEFFKKHCKSIAKRLILTYIFRDFSVGSLNLIFGLILTTFGIIWGSVYWIDSIQTSISASTGTIMIAVLTIILGFQLLLSFLSFDINNEPRIALQKYSE